MVNLSGKTALVTGASKGIGAATAVELAAAGCRVVLAARSKEGLKGVCDEIEAAGGEAEWAVCNVANDVDVGQAIDKCLTAFGSLDILVNNAGLIDPIARLEDSNTEAWSRVVDVNLKGAYYALRHAIPIMKKAGGGTIINISSGAATAAIEGWSHYCSTKAALLSLTKCVHNEEGENGIRCIGLSPGTVATDMQVEIRASGINPVSQLDPSVHIPSQWVGKAVVWLTGAEADAYCGTDFSLKTDEGRAAIGLPPVT